jgi:hypothetical protein
MQKWVATKTVHLVCVARLIHAGRESKHYEPTRFVRCLKITKQNNIYHKKVMIYLFFEPSE